MITPEAFEKIYEEYTQNIANARKQDHPEAQIIHHFISFLERGFGIKAREIGIERSVRIAKIERKGRIDLLFGDLIFEFKRELKGKRIDRQQLIHYLEGLKDEEGREYTGIFTDGLIFEVYAWQGEGFEKVDRFQLGNGSLSAEEVRWRLDAYLFSQTNILPTARDIEFRYGSQSPTFRKARKKLEELYQRVKDTPLLSTWRVQWERLLIRVYGEDISSEIYKGPIKADELFLRHTYLSQFARILAYAALYDLPDTHATIEGVLNGKAFKSSGARNIGGGDFFSWVLMPDIKDDALELFFRIAQSLIVYDLSRIDQDLLKQLYQNLNEEQHELGEYYTPDWLAELVLREIDYQPNQSLYDPACGSGTFLFSAIKHLEARGLHGQQLVEHAVKNICGTDVHPLAVIIARINYLLALSQHLQGMNTTIEIPVYMANALSPVIQAQSKDSEKNTLPIEVPPLHNSDQPEYFRIPNTVAQNPDLYTDMIRLIEGLAKTGQKADDRFDENVREKYQAHKVTLTDTDLIHWRKNLELLKTLIEDDRNGIWAFILSNLARPLTFAQRRFDVVVGNPPWLSYRYIKNKSYQNEVKKAYIDFELIETNDTKLFTQMDLSTLFYALSQDYYLKKGGTLAFVLPLSVITGAKQHRAFQAHRRISRILDFEEVEPLFNVPTCVLIDDGNTPTATVPSARFSAKLPAQELPLSRAEALLTRKDGKHRFMDDQIRSPHYHTAFYQGATLVPRNFCFVVPQREGYGIAVMTDPDVNRDTKAPYKDVFLRGEVHDPYLYATLLSKYLVPFGYSKLHLVALPFILKDGRLIAIEDLTEFIYKGHNESGEWFKQAARKWDELKKSTDKKTFIERLNYHNGVINQNPLHPYKVIQATSGSNIAAFVLESESAIHQVKVRVPKAIIIDCTTYYYEAASREEAHYLCAILNSTVINKAIKPYQPKGQMGARHINRLPFEACEIPEFDADDRDHQALAALSQAAHQQIELLKSSGKLEGRVSTIRRKARQMVEKELTEIDTIARRVVSF
ncbi:MAG: hypothetical protein D6712_02950 [Chloroflexi bacterium]|nr:MAG: hypothetical protein D6712_02950 [Chloroflexota bacterium]